MSRKTSRVTSSCAWQVGSEASTTYKSSEASSASSSVERKEATSSWGSCLRNPTVSDTSTRGCDSGCSARTVVSRVANSRSATSTSLPVSARISDDLPALV